MEVNRDYFLLELGILVLVAVGNRRASHPYDAFGVAFSIGSVDFTSICFFLWRFVFSSFEALA